MAGFLQEQLGGSAAAFENPVEQTSIISGVADLAGGFIRSLGTQTAPAKLTADERFGAALMAFQGEKGLIFNPKDPASFQKYMVEFTLKNPDLDGQAKSYAEGLGITLATSATQQFTYAQNLLNSDEFHNNVALQEQLHPDWSVDQLQTAALDEVTKNNALDARIANHNRNESNKWLDVENDYQLNVDQITNSLQVMLRVANKDQVQTPEELQQVRDYYHEAIRNINIPPGVSGADWSEFQTTYVSQITNVLEGSLSLTDGISEDTSKAIDAILGKAVAQGKLPASLLMEFKGNADGTFSGLNSVLQEFSKQLEAGKPFFDNYTAAIDYTFDELLEWVTEFEFQGADYLDRVDLTKFDALDNLGKLDSLASDNRKLSTVTMEPAEASLSILNVIEKVDSLLDSSIPPGHVNRIYSKGFFTNLANVNEANPELGSILSERAHDGLARQISTATIGIQSQASQAGFILHTDGTVTVDPTKQLPQMQDVVNLYFNGDWDAAIAAKGRFSGPAGIGARIYGLTVPFAELSETLNEIKIGAKFVASLEGKVQTLEDTVPTLLAPEVVTSSREVQLADDTGARTPTDSPMTGLIDSVEGLGKYDTLFNSGQGKSTPMRGYDITTKTIDELIEFSSSTGVYGAYQKATHPITLPDGTITFATPMGRYQFVGTTLKDVADRMGLARDTVFTQEVQDAMFDFHMRTTLGRHSTMEGKMEAVRGQWDGLNSSLITDKQLVRAIEAFEQGTPITVSGVGAVVSGVSGAPARRASPMATPERRATQPQSGEAPVAPESAPTEALSFNTPFEGSKLPVSDYPDVPEGISEILKDNRANPSTTLVFGSKEEFEKASSNLPDGTTHVLIAGILYPVGVAQ